MQSEAERESIRRLVVRLRSNPGAAEIRRAADLIEQAALSSVGQSAPQPAPRQAFDAWLESNPSEHTMLGAFLAGTRWAAPLQVQGALTDWPKEWKRLRGEDVYDTAYRNGWNACLGHCNDALAAHPPQEAGAPVEPRLTGEQATQVGLATCPICDAAMYCSECGCISAEAGAPVAPVGLTDERIDRVAVEVGMWERRPIWEDIDKMRRFARAILASTTSAAEPAPKGIEP